MSRSLPNPYRILGVKETASSAEIKKAYRKLAKANHPDSNDGDKDKEARFKEISAAYDIIGTDEKRAKYDALKRAGPGAIPDGVFDLGDLFNQMFGGNSPFGAGASQTGGVRYQVHRGPGPSTGQHSSRQGFSFSDFGSMFGDAMPSGRPSPNRRPPKKPAKKKPAKRRVILSDGSKATVNGLDIRTDTRVRLDQAILGAVIEVVTQKGKAKIRIPPGTSSGTQLRLRGKGLKHRDGRSGDHYITVQIDVPKKVSDEAARLLVQFMDKVSDDTHSPKSSDGANNSSTSKTSGHRTRTNP